MALPPRKAVALAGLLCAAVLGGCFGHQKERTLEEPIRSHVLTLYSSLPTQGPAAGVARAVGAGQRQALADEHGRAGRYGIRLIQLSSTKPGTGAWDPGLVNENASRAARDPRAIAYLGELNLGASAVSVPVTNKADILQVSPGDGLTSLTRPAPGRVTAGPERYFPSGHRTFLRLVPSDLSQAEAIVDRLEALGLDRSALVVGAGVYAHEFAGDLVAKAHEDGVKLVATMDLRDDPDAVLNLPRQLAAVAPNAVVLAIARERDTAAVLAGLERTLPQARLLTGAGILVGQPLAAARSAPSVPSPLEAVAPQVPTGIQRADARRTLRRIERGQNLQIAGPEALWGYESMRVALDAIDAAQRGGRPARRTDVVREALAGRLRNSPIGTYRVLPTGAVTGLPLGLYALQGARFELQRTLR